MKNGRKLMTGSCGSFAVPSWFHAHFDVSLATIGSEGATLPSEKGFLYHNRNVAPEHLLLLVLVLTTARFGRFFVRLQRCRLREPFMAHFTHEPRVTVVGLYMRR